MKPLHRQVMLKHSLMVLDHLHMLYLIVVTNIHTTNIMMYSDLLSLNGDIVGLDTRTDLVADTWFSTNGFNRGVLRGVIKLAYRS